MEEDIAPSRKKLKWQEEDHRRSLLHRQMWEKRRLKKKKEHEVSIFSHHPADQLTTWTAQRKEEITSYHIPKQNKIQEPNKSLQKKLWLRVAIAVIRFVSFLFLVEKKSKY